VASYNEDITESVKAKLQIYVIKNEKILHHSVHIFPCYTIYETEFMHARVHYHKGSVFP
jgi:hypothetical protein